MQQSPKVAVVMGSKSDWDTMENAVNMLKQLDIVYHTQIISAHRTPDILFDFANNARATGYEVIIAGAGGAAHLPGMIAAKTSLPVLGVPIQSKALNGMDSLLSIAQMPKGIAVGTLAIGTSGAINAALLAASILSLHDKAILSKLDAFRQKQTDDVLNNLNPES